MGGPSNKDMKTKLIVAAAALLASVSVFQTAALAQNEGRAQLRLTIVDETNAPLPNAIVTVYTIQGPRDVNTDEKGLAIVADLPAELTQWFVKTPGHVSSADAAKLKAGVNTQAVTLHTVKSESGS